MTAGAEAALKRGDDVYVTRLVGVGPLALSQWIGRIEGVGWKLEHQEQVRIGKASQDRRPEMLLTFRRV